MRRDVCWIDYGRFAEDGIAVRLLRAVLRNALADGAIASEQESVGNKLSPGHKSEVAGGLIVWTNVKQLHANKRAARRRRRHGGGRQRSWRSGTG